MVRDKSGASSKTDVIRIKRDETDKDGKRIGCDVKSPLLAEGKENCHGRNPNTTTTTKNDSNENEKADEQFITNNNNTTQLSPSSLSASRGRSDIIRSDATNEIIRGVLRQKLSKMRHFVLNKAIHPDYLDSIFPSILRFFAPQTVMYNGGIAKIKEWKISCYLEVMEGGIPCTEPNLALLGVCRDLLACCNVLFAEWYRQQHSCNNSGGSKRSVKNSSLLFGNENQPPRVKRLMTFITRYTAAPGEQALLKHVDGAGKVDGSVVVALPIDRWSAPEEVNTFEGHGGGLTFWDGKCSSTGRPHELKYDTRCGDVAFIDRAVWHQANPISKGTRWALVIFYKVF